ncbi:FtsH protease activity modulator HflK [Psychrobium sp. 1_MG-2023]|uniref:FtsH protease activity modulator HflK n=1 Tax=Psychrobium sp. 1_MG-2023 TaxID=3062624 RepID=UPI000C333108|nr:FtsH protease activity modulator HflK [Psychrobium sp. 1_MG-2023]MDP2559727.1 FtsH protease activity modulator HflK [Psychrobium sp. 1_MG-2023]PKF59556.1 FtsH protease activity modulator HflK [Alteromonadales bacterium alter-6D02]
MAWNEPGNQGKDPWGGNKGGKDQGPPDLDEVLGNLSKKFGGIFGGKSGGGKQGGNFSGAGFALLLGLLGIVWFVSGFYTIKEAERGVVLRFGLINDQVNPGLHWKPTFIDNVLPVDIEAIRSLPAAGFMLTQDENVVRVEMDVQYRVVNPEHYLFSAVDPANSLSHATDSALRYVVGHTTMNDLLTTGRELVRQQTEVELNKIIESYKLGFEIVDVNFLPARPPEEVKGAFDDAIAAQEDEERYLREAEAYALSIEPQARGQVRRLEQEAHAYKQQQILKATGEVARFSQLLPEYNLAKEVTRERIYLETIESVYANANKVVVDVDGSNNMMYLPLDKIISKHAAPAATTRNSVTAPVKSTNSQVTESLRNFSRDDSRQGRN